jgi:hypothetical protein
VAPQTFVIVYAAHTTACTFLLDADGICRRIVMNPSNKRRDSAKTASQCVGAQYVASLDGSVAGCLVEMPRVGAAMLFARVDDRGRVALVRTGPVTRFEAEPAEDPFDDQSVKTSAPPVPRTRPTLQPVAAVAKPRSDADHDPDYFDASDRTVRLPAPPSRDDDFATDEYPSAPEAGHVARSSLAPSRRSTMPSPEPHPATLRDPRVEIAEEDDPYAQHAQPVRAVSVRRTEPYVKAARAARTSSSRWATDAKVATRRRRER